MDKPNHEGYEKVPPYILGSLDAYLEDRRPVGQFLEAVLSNDLYEAVNRADIPCLRTLNLIVMYVTNKFTSDCYGSPKRYKEWINGQHSSIKNR